VRVTLAEVERRAARRNRSRKRERKLPLTVQAVTEVCEKVEAFQLRRILWHIAVLSGDGGAPRP
jgi:hypothetical protein